MYQHMCMIHTGDTMNMDQLDNACDTVVQRPERSLEKKKLEKKIRKKNCSAKTLKEFSLVG